MAIESIVVDNIGSRLHISPGEAEALIAHDLIKITHQHHDGDLERANVYVTAKKYNDEHLNDSLAHLRYVLGKDD